MSNLIVYFSETGFTKNYALKLAEQLNCSAISVGDFKKTAIDTNTTVIYGGSIMADSINGLNKFRENYKGKLVVFGVGATAKSDDYTQKLIFANNLENIPFYYLPGGVHLKQLNFMKRTMFKFGFNASNKTNDKEKAKINDFDLTDYSLLDSIVEKYKAF